MGGLTKKIILTILGIFFSLLLLEAGLRVGGLAVLFLQKHSQEISIRQRGSYRIMCLGESTTAIGGETSFPSQLQELLNQSNTGLKFTVINKGMNCIDSGVIVSNLEKNLESCKPDMVVAMMGINDGGIKYYEGIPDLNGPLFNKSRLYRYVMVLWRQITNKIKEARNAGAGGEARLREELLEKTIAADPQNETAYFELGKLYWARGKTAQIEGLFRKFSGINHKSGRAYIEMARFFMAQGKNAQAEEAYQKAIALETKDEWVYIELGRLCRIQGKFAGIEELYQKAIALNPKNEWSYIELGRFYFGEQRYPEAEEAYQKAIALNPGIDYAYLELGWLYLDRSEFAKAEELYRKAVQLNPGSDKELGAMAVVYAQMGKNESSRQYSEKTAALRKGRCSGITAANYRKLKTVLDARGIKLVCVQYPMRSIAPLKRIFAGSSGNIYVDNEMSFKEAVGKSGFKDYFIDMFGGDFGHCTPKGNRLIAENTARAILKEVTGK